MSPEDPLGVYYHQNNWPLEFNLQDNLFIYANLADKTVRPVPFRVEDVAFSDSIIIDNGILYSATYGFIYIVYQSDVKSNQIIIQIPERFAYSSFISCGACLATTKNNTARLPPLQYPSRYFLCLQCPW